MRQTFTSPGQGSQGPGRLARLRTEMERIGVDGLLIPRADVHQGEYVPAADERLAWTTGFTGSAGLACALAERAAVFVDGRYTLQATQQVEGAAFEIHPLHDLPVGDWLTEAAPASARIGYDPWLHGKTEIDALAGKLARIGGAPTPLDANPVDAVWEDRPAPPAAAIRIQPEGLSGESAARKRARVGETIAEAEADAAVLTLPDSIAWLFNIRGGDIPRNPVPLVFAILRADGTATIFVRPGQTDDALEAHLGAHVAIAPWESFAAALAGMTSDRVLLDRRSSPLAVARILEEANAKVVWGADPCIAPKAIKNRTEQQGARDAHLRDGAAMARFLAWLDEAAPEGGLTEIAIARRLEEERTATNLLMDISFDTISGAGPNGAIVHYRVTEETDRALGPSELMLVDSGGQYLDGTTDITRTMLPAGEASASAARAFTLVLKGMIAVSRARFPKGTTGRDIDTMARMALWRAGFDYDHGTGHGIGAYLCVHEGPQSLSRRGHVALEPGMICSNEPGYYRESAFGIRIENLLIVTAPEIPEGGDRPMMGFETLTLAPIDRRLIERGALDAEERNWLDTYHARVLAEIGPQLDDARRAWLQTACAAI